MAKRQREWVWVRSLQPAEKAEIAVACEHFIATFLKPRFLPEIRPTEFNYPVDIFGKWRGSKYSFVTRYRSGFPDNAGAEFDSPFTRLDHAEDRLRDTRFHVMWHRHTGQWWRVHEAVPFDEALRLIETSPTLWPAI